MAPIKKQNKTKRMFEYFQTKIYIALFISEQGEKVTNSFASHDNDHAIVYSITW